MWSITVRADNTSSGIIRSQPSPVQHSSSEGLNRARTPHGARLRPSSRMLAPGRGTWYTGREEARRTRASGARSEAEKVGSRRRGTVRRRARAPHHGAGTHPRAFGSGWYPGYESVTERRCAWFVVMPTRAGHHGRCDGSYAHETPMSSTMHS